MAVLAGRGKVWPAFGSVTTEVRAMPFVNITINAGHPKERKDEIARRVTDTITDVCKLPREAVWVVFNEVTPADWYVAGNPGKK